MARLARSVDPLHRVKRWMRFRGRAPSSVLVVAAGGLGDTVLFSLVLPRFMALAAPGETVTVLLRSDAAKMAFLFPRGVEVLAVDFGRLAREPLYRWRMFDALFDGNFRLAVTADFLRHPLTDEALLLAAAAGETIGMRARPWRKYDRKLGANAKRFARLFDSGPVRLDKVVRWARFADWATGRAEATPRIALPPGRLPPPEKVSVPFVLVQPFSAVRAKQVSAASLRRIVEAVPAGYDVVIAGAPSDPARNPDYAELLRLPSVRFDDSPLEALAAMLQAATLVVSVDTAVMHLAVVAGAPTVCLASAGFVGEIVPYADEIMPANATFLFHDMPCRGCLGACTQPLEDGRFACVARLDLEPALARIRALAPGVSG
jgi:ADP-heptose:LPS heptosyltransferase